MPPMRGFTTIELLTVVAVLAIMATLAAPNMSGLIERNRLKAAAEQVARDLDLARAEAIKQGTRVWVDFNPNGWCEGPRLGNTPCDCTSSSSCAFLVNGTPVYTRTSGSDFLNITLGSLNFTGNTVGFDNVRGAPVDGTGKVASGDVLLVSPSGLSLDVQLSIIGHVFVCAPSGNIPGYPSCS